MHDDPFKNPGEETPENDAPSPSFMMQEMWSLQQEVLKEVLTGFRALEERQRQLEDKLAESLEAQVQRIESIQASQQSPETLVKALDARFAEVASNVTELEQSLRRVLGASGSSLQQQLEQAVERLEGALLESQRLVEALGNEVRQTLKDAAADSQRDLTDALAKEHERLASQIEQRVQSGLDGVREVLVRDLGGRIDESAGALQSDLQEVAESVQEVRALGPNLEQSLEGITREVRDIGSVAGRLESSTVLTQELLDEQRRFAEEARQRDNRERARKHNNAGVLCYHQGAYDTSVDHFLKALELDDSLAEAWNNLGLSYTEMGRDDEASAAFQKALALDPSGGQVYSNLGYLYYRQGDLENAVEMYQRAVQRSSDTSAAYTNLGNALYRMKRVDESVQAWRRAIEIDPANHKAAAALERLGLESAS